MTSIGRKQHSPNSQKLRTLLAVILIAVGFISFWIGIPTAKGRQKSFLDNSVWSDSDVPLGSCR
jgi:hypothetical protein